MGGIDIIVSGCVGDLFWRFVMIAIKSRSFFKGVCCCNTLVTPAVTRTRTFHGCPKRAGRHPKRRRA